MELLLNFIVTDNQCKTILRVQLTFLNFWGIPATVQYDMSLIVKIPTQDPIPRLSGSSSGSGAGVFMSSW
jgi:hypothetical protein